MFKRQKFGIVVVFLAIVLCFSMTQPSYSATIITLESLVSPLDDIGAIQFDILGPVSADVSNFTANFPNGWFDFSSGTLVQAFDSVGDASLPLGIIGSFDIDVTLGNWVLSDQSGNVLKLDLDYLIREDGTNYRIDAVPIPSTIMLLGGGLMGLVAVRRRRRA